MSNQQWKGAVSQKFQGGRRRLEVLDQLGKGLQPNHYPRPQGLRTFSLDPTKQIQHRSTLKVFTDKYISDKKQIDLRGRKALFLPDQVQRIRPELRHISGGSTTLAQFQPKGIKVYEHANFISNSQYQLQNKLQRKARILGLQPQRNDIGVSAMGDKPYKYPQYAVDFFKSGGLIPGSTTTYHSKKQQFTIDEKKLKSVFTKPHWHLKVKMEQKEQQRMVIGSVDDWEKTILKQNNPNYNDPDTFFQRMEAAQNTGGKDIKKGGKK